MPAFSQDDEENFSTNEGFKNIKISEEVAVCENVTEVVKKQTKKKGCKARSNQHI